MLQLCTIWLIKDRMKSRRALFTIVYFCQWRGLTKNWPSWSWEFLHAILIYICFEERLVTHYQLAAAQWKFCRFWVRSKVRILWEGHKIWKKIVHFKKKYLAYIQKKVGDFFKFLWPSQNIWTLTFLIRAEKNSAQ